MNTVTLTAREPDVPSACAALIRLGLSATLDQAREVTKRLVAGNYLCVDERDTAALLDYGCGFVRAGAATIAKGSDVTRVTVYLHKYHTAKHVKQLLQVKFDLTLDEAQLAHQYRVEGKSIGVRYTDFPEFQNHGFYKGRA